ncbi:glutamate-5-semialdehyde dehydrogenase [Roseococcus sp. SDR]|uniref:glutamate-5-semialdehyde dehydrogenase n=1 Tax=Roseococcus sp. SDR TaxID=2835532 RepID=UPI001BD00F84|nr:glutamate-5-semialdehyde dehydrogenase [Roseococcus sp. SDR]MBS7791728.1 glutamate-5-semialdehyde dehydrogenase [Roseococcus sp. SDR]MBV1847042.1 glutamate-5-semialdehyde dehydrogenase [Roseococcus sp. SDR]
MTALSRQTATALCPKAGEHPVNAITDATAQLLDTAARAARAAAGKLARAGTAPKNAALRHAAAAIRAQAPAIQAANETDLAAAPNLSASFRDRLTLTPPRIEAMAKGLEEVAELPDPVGRVLAEWVRPNGLRFQRVAQPLGVIGMIFESRPNVTADAGALCLKAGSAVLLRGGSESTHSARAIAECLRQGLSAAGLPEAAIQLAPTQDRAFVGAMLRAAGLIDLIIPRGGKGLVTRVMEEARVPVLAHAEGLCHTYVHAAADPAMARAVLLDAKLRRTGVCGSTETLLIDAAVAPSLLPLLVADLAAKGCRFHADDRARAICPGLDAATDEHFGTEWLDAVLNIAVVDGVETALAHIRRFGSEHTEAIITEDAAAAEAFLAGIDSAVGLWNASTQFCDGGEFGFGAEIGIATGRMHARGPVGLEQLCTFRYRVTGTGQVRG